MKDAFEPTKMSSKIILPLYAVLIPYETRVIMFSQEELKNGETTNDLVIIAKSMDKSMLSSRLYLTTQFFSEDGRVKFIHHIEARNDKSLVEAYGVEGKNGSSKFDPQAPAPKLLLSKSNLNMLIENRDFTIDGLGNIIFND